MSVRTVLLLAACLFSTVVRAENWAGTENGLTDSWKMNKGAGDAYSGSGTVSLPTGAYTAAATAVISGGYFFAHREPTPDGNQCNYFGNVVDNTANGTYTCKNGGPYNFSVGFK